MIVVRERDGFVAYSAVCTHLGCLVRWDGAKQEFLCPCHAAVFDRHGAVVSGPPPAPLPSYDVKEVDGRVFTIDEGSGSTESALIELTAEGGPKVGLTTPGYLHGLAKVR